MKGRTLGVAVLGVLGGLAGAAAATAQVPPGPPLSPAGIYEGTLKCTESEVSVQDSEPSAEPNFVWTSHDYKGTVRLWLVTVGGDGGGPTMAIGTDMYLTHRDGQVINVSNPDTDFTGLIRAFFGDGVFKREGPDLRKATLSAGIELYLESSGEPVDFPPQPLNGSARGSIELKPNKGAQQLEMTFEYAGAGVSAGFPRLAVTGICQVRANWMNNDFGGG